VLQEESDNTYITSLIACLKNYPIIARVISNVLKGTLWIKKPPYAFYLYTIGYN